MASLGQRTATSECAKCHKAFVPGDRVLLVSIVYQVSRNPATRDVGAWLSEDFELAHVSCPDPGLEGKLIHA
jgi:hypothetical protein